MDYIDTLFVKEKFIFGKTNKIPEDRIDLHFHDMYEIYMLLSGEISYMIEGDIYKISAGDVIITNCKELHKPIYNQENQILRQYIQFKPAYLFNINEYQIDLSSCFENRKLGEFNIIGKSQISGLGIDKIFDEINNEVLNSGAYSKIIIKNYMMIMLCKINTIFANSKVSISRREMKNEKVREIIEFINQNLKNQITLDILEKKMYLNKYYLCHIFKVETGYSLMEYITQKRIMLAKSLLLDGSTPAISAKTSGFNDYSNFYKSFKNYVGVSPKDFITNRKELIYKGEERFEDEKGADK